MIKVGGSLCDEQLLPRLAAAIRELAETRSLTIVPGGGPFANAVRDWDNRLHLDDSASHWMAIAAMDQYGLLLESLGMGVAVNDPSALSSPHVGAHIFLPYRFLRNTDSLPHTWSVTSDSIAAYLASLFKLDRLILLKPTDAPMFPCPVRIAMERGLVDRDFDHYLSDKTECWIVNGTTPERLLEFDRSGCPRTRMIPDHQSDSESRACRSSQSSI